MHVLPTVTKRKNSRITTKVKVPAPRFLLVPPVQVLFIRPDLFRLLRLFRHVLFIMNWQTHLPFFFFIPPFGSRPALVKTGY